MAWIENPTGKANLIIWDNSYKVSWGFNPCESLGSVSELSEIKYKDIIKLVAHAEGLLGLAKDCKLKGNPDLVALDESIREAGKGNFVLEKMLGAVHPTASDESARMKKHSLEYYSRLMSEFVNKLDGTDPKNRFRGGRFSRYLPKFLEAMKGFYEELPQHKVHTLGDGLRTDQKIAATACAAAYQLGVDNIVVLTRDYKHLFPLIHRARERLFCENGELRESYGIKGVPQKDFSIKALSIPVEKLYKLGIVERIRT